MLCMHASIKVLNAYKNDSHFVGRMSESEWKQNALYKLGKEMLSY